MGGMREGMLLAPLAVELHGFLFRWLAAWLGFAAESHIGKAMCMQSKIRAASPTAHPQPQEVFHAWLVPFFFNVGSAVNIGHIHLREGGGGRDRCDVGVWQGGVLGDGYGGSVMGEEGNQGGYGGNGKANAVG